jgi:hypothetical protein
MRGHSRSKNGIASLAYDLRILVFGTLSKTWMAGSSPAMTDTDVLTRHCERSEAIQCRLRST